MCTAWSLLCAMTPRRICVKQTEVSYDKSTVTTRVLLVCGTIAGPFFTVMWFIAGATRPHCNPLRHPISSLALGNAGYQLHYRRSLDVGFRYRSITFAPVAGSVYGGGVVDCGVCYWFTWCPGTSPKVRGTAPRGGVLEVPMHMVGCWWQDESTDDGNLKIQRG